MRILVTEPLHQEGIDFLRREFEVEVKTGLPVGALQQQIGNYDALITRSGTAVTAELLGAGAGRLKVVGRAGIGVDNIDIRAATQYGIAVVNSPNGNVQAAAEHTIALMFALARHIPQAHALLRNGVWGKHRFVGCQLAGKTLGIIGLGRVGGQVAARAMALGMQVIAHDPFISPKPDISLVPLDDLLSRADFISLHVPLTPITLNMIGARELDLMKESAYLINCARGRVVDEEALYEVCRQGRIAGAALDVFATEPLTHSGLLELDNVIVTPHLGGTTHEALRASALEVAEQVRTVLLGEHPRHIVNPEVLHPPAPVTPCTLNQWAKFDRVVFDCDSTLSAIEGVNELAAMNGVLCEVAEMTTRSMCGQVPFEQVFARRLELIRPTARQLAALGALYTSTLVEDAVAVVSALTFVGIEVHLISGGYREALLPVARKLGLHPCHLHANQLYFDDLGQYAGFDAANPLARSGGKREVLRRLPPVQSTLFTGDGASDAEVCADVDLFVGYGGVEKRGAVSRLAPVYLHTRSLAPLVVMAAGMEGCRTLLAEPRHRPLVIKGLSILLREGTADYRCEYRPFFDRIRKFCLEGICS
jgi:HAD superfamily phosphoserine phosphatase-like hydrolase